MVIKEGRLISRHYHLAQDDNPGPNFSLGVEDIKPQGRARASMAMKFKFRESKAVALGLGRV